ncbi:uncharacterized protein N7483_002488 [Penicillium malachiteum]|uniref:uncharacterized protein n=1 Tax=Penicillium malachiteum TaxID=1324776 RepID=UPI002548F11A|nr:uncharacterized protein N7483_002488 [Penicillium malachiteum]KAJ5737363.1 hypothetical protein N7483_002488 [Penicillium malachiteum]
MNRYSTPRLEPISEEITPTDHFILCQGGTSSNLERLPSRLERSKHQSPSLKRQFEDTAYEMSYLKAELQWHKESRQILLNLREQVLGIYQALEESLEEATVRLHESEQRYLSIWDKNESEVAI